MKSDVYVGHLTDSFQSFLISFRKSVFNSSANVWLFTFLCQMKIQLSILPSGKNEGFVQVCQEDSVEISSLIGKNLQFHFRTPIIFYLRHGFKSFMYYISHL